MRTQHLFSQRRLTDEADDRKDNNMSNKIVYNASNKPFAQKLRREMTRQERHLWYDFLKAYPVAFRRQKQIGPYIVDFYCAKARLVVEIDGSQHYEAAGRKDDEARDSYLQGWGLKILRFSNHDVDCRFQSVCETIDLAVREDS